jgi:uncharacterized protein YecT (DUF1311 family)
MKIRVFYVSLVFLSGFSLTNGVADAPKNAASPPCEETTETQADIEACAGTRETTAEQRHDQAFREILRYVDGDEKARLLAAERAWRTFLDADCAFWSLGDGEMSPVNKAYCAADLFDKRAQELESWPPNAPRDALVPHQ